MTPLRLLFVGHSHLSAIHKAYRRFGAKGNGFAIEAEFVQLSRAEFRPQFKPGFFRKDILNRRTIKAIRRAKNDVLVSCIGGNVHNVFGLVNHPQPFEFILPDEPDLPVADNAEILPHAAMRLALAGRMRRHLRLLQAVRRHMPGRMLHLESPPPIPSTEYILAHPGTFGKKIVERGIAPVWLRYKLWRLASTIFREECITLGIEWVPVPRQMQDADGMLIARAWSRDATHANPWYGRCLLRNLATRLRPNATAASGST